MSALNCIKVATIAKRSSGLRKSPGMPEISNVFYLLLIVIKVIICVPIEMLVMGGQREEMSYDILKTNLNNMLVSE